MLRALTTSALLAAVSGSVLLPSTAAQARAADTFRYDVVDERFAICDEPATLVGTVSVLARSTGAESGMYTSTFIDRTTGTITVGGDTYRYRQSSTFTKVESLETNDTRTLRLAGSVRLAGNGPLAGTVFDQFIHVVEDATGVTRVDTYVSSFC